VYGPPTCNLLGAIKEGVKALEQLLSTSQVPPSQGGIACTDLDANLQ
jgi:hypothetical protein